MKVDVRTFKDIESLSRAAAEIFVQAAANAVRARGRFLVALSGGSTPSVLYRLLSTEPLRDQIDWQHTFLFWGDERCVPPEEEGSNYRQANEILLKHVPIPDRNILRIKGELPPEEASDAYAHSLKHFADPGLDWPRFDLVLLGMGADGHTASLFPGSQVNVATPTLAVSANYQGRPAQRVTLTPIVFNSARVILFLVAGADKTGALQHVLSDEFSPGQYPRNASGQRMDRSSGLWMRRRLPIYGFKIFVATPCLTIRFSRNGMTKGALWVILFPQRSSSSARLAT